MNNLIQRIESAEGPSRELDAEIAGKQQQLNCDWHSAYLNCLIERAAAIKAREAGQ